MQGLTLRTKFIAGFAALLVMVAALTFTSLRAMNSLNSGLDNVVHRTSIRADRTSQVGEGLVELTGYQSGFAAAFCTERCRRGRSESPLGG